MRKLVIIFAFLCFGTQLNAEELKLTCKTRSEITHIMDPNDYDSIDETRYGSTVNIAIGDAIIDDKDLILFPIYDCAGPLRVDFGETEVNATCWGLVTKSDGQNYPTSSKSITVNRYTGNIEAVLTHPTVKGGIFMHIYEGTCSKAKQKF
jgi:hypothetical protein